MKRYLGLAEERLDALLALMLCQNVLYHQTLLGKTPTQKALLEDYAFLMDALLLGYERTYNQKYLSLAEKLSREALATFYRDKKWFLSDDGIKAEADFDDRYYTAALSVMLENLVRLSSITTDLRLNDIVKETLVNQRVYARRVTPRILLS